MSPSSADLPVVFDQSYPPNTVEFASIIRALKAAKPDIVYVASYPPDSAGILRAVNEIGIGDDVKIFGGGMVGLQFAAVMSNLGSLLNGVVNYNTWLPEPSMYFDGTKAFFDTYTKRAVEAKVDPLGYYLAPFGYAMGQMIEAAVNATKSLDQKGIAKYLRENEHKTIVGPIAFSADGERKETATLQAQFRGVKDKDIEQFRVLRQAGDPVPGQTEDRKSHQSLRGGPQSRPRGFSGPGRPRGDLTCFRWTCCLAQWCLGCCSAASMQPSASGCPFRSDCSTFPMSRIRRFWCSPPTACTSSTKATTSTRCWRGSSITPLFFLFGLLAYRVYYETFERRGSDAGVRGIAFFFGIAFIIEVLIILQFGVDQRSVTATYIGKSWRFGEFRIPIRQLVAFAVALGLTVLLAVYLSKTFMGRAIRAVAQDEEALRLMGANPVRIKQFAFGIATAVLGIAGALLIIVAPVEPTLDRAYIGRTFCVVVMAGLGSMSGTLIAAIILGVAESIVLTMFGASWAPAISFAMLLGVLAVRPQGLLGR